jgi:hypothetical protein
MDHAGVGGLGDQGTGGVDDELGAVGVAEPGVELGQIRPVVQGDEPVTLTGEAALGFVLVREAGGADTERLRLGERLLLPLGHRGLLQDVCNGARSSTATP